MKETQKLVRMGVLHLLVLVIALCLTVLAVLTLATANASERLSAREAQQLHEVYALEVKGQEFLAKASALAKTDASNEEIKDRLATDARSGSATEATAGSKGGENGQNTAATSTNIQANFQTKDGIITATFTTESNQQLVCKLRRLGNGFEIIEWKSTKQWSETDAQKNNLLVF